MLIVALGCLVHNKMWHFRFKEKRTKLLLQAPLDLGIFVCSFCRFEISLVTAKHCSKM